MLRSRLKKIFLNKQSIVLVLGLFWLPIIVFGILNIGLISSIIQQDSLETLKRAAEIQSNSVDKFIRVNFEQVTSIANSKRISDLLAGKKETVLSKHNFNILYSLFLTEVILVDSKGIALASSLKSKLGRDRNDQDHIKYAFREKRSQMVVNSKDKISPEIIFSAPVFSTENECIGVFVLKYSLSILQEVVSPHHDLAGHKSYGIIINDKEDVIASTVDFDLNFNTLSVYDEQIYRLSKDLATKKKIGYFFDKSEVGLAQYPVGQTEWVSIYVKPKDSSSGAFKETTNNVMMILVLVFILAVFTNVIIYSLIKRIRDREKTLKKMNDEIMADLQLGVQVQRALQYVPRLPRNLDFVTYQKAAKFVSGDLCFTFWNSALHLFTFMIIDVNGKGIQAALKAAAFSSIAKSVWTSRDSYGGDQDRFDIFVKAADRFIQSTDFNHDFLAVVGCEFNIKTNEVSIYRLNYTSPFKLELDGSGSRQGLSRINIPNGETVKTTLEANQALVLLGDAFLESSRSEKKIVREIKNYLAQPSGDVAARKIADVIMATDLGAVKEDDQTILILKKAS